MATTSNFGWTTPDDTDLVKDGALAIRTLGNNIDTSLLDLKGGTTGQVLSKNSNTDLDFVWTAGGDITEVAAGTGISGGGSSGSVTITNSMATAIDAKGDLVPGTGADAFARLAVGANGTVLTADSAETTGMKWASPASGGMTELATGSLSGSFVEITGISGSYIDLELHIIDAYPANDGEAIRISFGAPASNTFYDSQGTFQTNRNVTGSLMTVQWDNDNTDGNNLSIVRIPAYSETAPHKIVYSFTNSKNATTATNFNYGLTFSIYKATGAISTLRIYADGGNLGGGTYKLYGVK